MKRLLCILLVLLAGRAAFGQDPLETIRQDRYAVGGNHHTYMVPEIRDTRPPRGYKPFYFSYYGRHGSRFLSHASSISKALSGMDSLHEAGLLTEQGEEIRSHLRNSADLHEGMEGMLTSVGYREEQGISRRMFKRFKRIFRQKGSRRVIVRSSPLIRSLQTGTAYIMELQKKAPRLDFDVLSGKRFYFSNWDPNPSLDAWEHDYCDSIMRAETDAEAAAKRIFTDPAKALGMLGNPDVSELIYAAINILTISRCIGAEGDPMECFTENELLAYFKAHNARLATWFINTEETGCYRDTNAGAHLLREFIQKADEALAGNGVCADLRFGHDTGVAPIMSLMRVEGYDHTGRLADTWKYWPAWKNVPMGCNYALVFYRNRKGDVLVKLILNEKETAIPAVSPVKGPYYRWSDLRDYCAGLCGLKD